MRVIVIDPQTREIYEKTIENELSEMQKIVGGYISVCYQRYPNGDEIIVNDEGLFNSDNHAFLVLGHQQPYVGTSFVSGEVDRSGEMTDAKSSITEIKRTIMWLGRRQDY